MDNERNYYETLHVQQDAPDAVIKSSYRAIMQKMRCHPDLGGDEHQAQLINIAYSTLIDRVKRTAYDVEIQNKKQRADLRAVNANKKTDNDGPKTNVDTKNGPSITFKSCDFCGHASAAGTQPINSNYQHTACCIQCGAPSKKVDMFTINRIINGDMRQLPRLKQRTTATVFESWQNKNAFDAIILDFSIKGIRLQSHIASPSGHVLHIKTDSYDCLAVVRNCKQANIKDQFILGLEFKTLELQSKPGGFFQSSA